jgi:hypothetical protein
MARNLSLKRFYGDAEGPLGFPMRSEIAKVVEQALAQQSEDLKSLGCTVLMPSGEEQFVQGYLRTFHRAKKVELGDREEVSWITTDSIDRDFEVIVPKGVDWGQFKKNPVVTWAHDYRALPMGRSLWVVREQAKKFDGWKAKTRYTSKPETWMGDWFIDAVWHFIKMGDLPGKSIGFIPLAGHAPNSSEVKNRPELAEVRLIIDKSLALEYAVAPVQSNPDALVAHVAEARSKGLEIPQRLLEDVGIIVPNEVNLTDLEPADEEPTTTEGLEGKVLENAILKLPVEPVPAGKPYPNEHACRKAQPSIFSEFRRENNARKHNGKPYHIIWGKKKSDGKWGEQAYRYPKGSWSSSDARTHCKSHGGIGFEAASGATVERVTVASIRASVRVEVGKAMDGFDPKTIARDALDLARGRV